MCQTASQVGLGVLHLCTVSWALMANWVARLLRSADNIVTLVLTNSCCGGLHWERQTALVEGALPFGKDCKTVSLKCKNLPS